MSKVICPRCGGEVVLPEKSEIVVGKTISEEGNATYVLNMKEKENKKVNNAENRKMTLEVNGITTEGYFSLQLPNGKTVFMDQEGKSIDANLVGADICNPNLHRRWIMAQWFRQNNNPHGYADAISGLTYDYQWKVVSNELKALAKLETSDKEYFEERLHFFNTKTITWMLNEYVQDLKYKLKYSKAKKCKGIPYYHIGGKDIFVSDVDRKLFIPLEAAIKRFEHSANYTIAYRNFESIKKVYLKVYKPDKKFVGQAFKDCYKGAGAYYTLQNMVLYHGCTLGEYKEHYSGRWNKVAEYKGMEAYKYMKSLLDEYRDEGWRWVGVLRQCISDNNFSFGK